MAPNSNQKIDIIIPAFKAHETIIRTLSSITLQTIKDDLNVLIVNDDPSGPSYEDICDIFRKWIRVNELRLSKNGGPGVARQSGIDLTKNPFFTCIDADDTFAGAIALETLRAGITENDVIKCCSSQFMQLGEDLKHMVGHQNDMVWMFGKIYRRDFIEKYNIKFNETRANEDTGFNTMVRLLCDNPNEQLRFIKECTYFWHNKKDSITRINDGQYALDQCFCGWTDNMIYAIKHAREYKPFSGGTLQWMAHVMVRLYYYWIETASKKPVFADQNWEYVKKYYNECYKKIESDISDKAFSEMFGMVSMESMQSGSMIGVIPKYGIKEFMDKLHKEPYNSHDIYKIWGKMWENKETRKLMQNNIDCGVCADGYAKGLGSGRSSEPDSGDTRES